MILAASLLALVAVATAVPSATPPNKCCIPDKVEMSIVDPKKWGTGDLEVTLVSSDASLKKEAFITSTVVPGQPSVYKSRTVLDYNLHKMFIITPPNNLCHTEDFDAPYTSCYPDGTTVLASSYVGDRSVGETFGVVSFQFGQSNYTVVVDKNCVPIVQYIKGKFGKYDLDTTQFISGFKAGNSDPTVYDVPPTCK